MDGQVDGHSISLVNRRATDTIQLTNVADHHIACVGCLVAISSGPSLERAAKFSAFQRHNYLEDARLPLSPTSSGTKRQLIQLSECCG